MRNRIRVSSFVALGSLLAIATCGSKAFAIDAASPASHGLSVNNHNRNDVIAFWHENYLSSEGYEKRIKWTGNYNGKAGSTSKDFIKDVERRINYFRAMAGVPANVEVNTPSTVVINSSDPFKPSPSTKKSDAAQQAALMLILNYNPSNGSAPAFTHNPSRSLKAWSSAAWNANANGNLGFGIYGPGAITEYMAEELSTGTATSSWNSSVGHRRWILYPNATHFATGDTPGRSASTPPTNVLYVSHSDNELASGQTSNFVAYPTPGYFPAPINSRFWSFSLAGADFSSAKIRMTDTSGKAVPVSMVKSGTGYGDPAIIWKVEESASSSHVSSDKTFRVTVSGVRGVGNPSSFSYSVTLINPDRLTSPHSITGPSSANSKAATAYFFTPPAEAEALRINTFRQRRASWKEQATKSSRKTIIDNTSPSYPLLAKMKSKRGFGKLSGSKAFNLTFPTSYDLIERGVPVQSFEIARDILPKKRAKLKFLYRRGYMTTGSTLILEISKDGGVTWKTLGKPITGKSNTNFDTSISSASYRLKKSSKPVRIRFRYFVKGIQPIFTHEAMPKDPTGIFIDKITTKNCNWLEPAKTTALSPKVAKFQLSTSTAGASLKKGGKWAIALQTKLGGKWFPNGSVKKITVKHR